MFLLFFLFSSLNLNAVEVNVSLQDQIEHNSHVQITDVISVAPPIGSVRLVPEFSDQRYLVMSFYPDISAADRIQHTILSHLDIDIKLIAIIVKESDRNKVYEKLSSILSPNRFRIICIESAGAFPLWSRDAWPKTLISEDGKLNLVGARYFQNFEPEEFLKSVLPINILNYDFYFEHGNILGNSKGDCFIVDNLATKEISNIFFEIGYGCTNLYRLPHTFGIGHIDEIFRFVNDDTVLVDSVELAEDLVKKGFRAFLLPKPSGYVSRNANYLNVLQLNKKIYLPQFGVPEDSEAKMIYETLGYEVVTVDTQWFFGDGFIHCLTKTYPPGVFDFLF
ncbi:MAG: agmatine deiminase family protein [Bdellovibrionaceae bacterium]|nr:agmatine deiminase family protein [Pseudobdellovibrionaceae bacterium]